MKNGQSFSRIEDSPAFDLKASMSLCFIFVSLKRYLGVFVCVEWLFICIYLIFLGEFCLLIVAWGMHNKVSKDWSW